ncbi:cyclophilin type peptidyl-prolyl cis-trans isomerase [Nitzschia inconspicua]|uniref:Cyclophilin type peptidyl-prolyl cis-trans isomerase n=1 Tax=Nitzschia inconspicua TaxID=303405 RepID=A0A9K3LAK2_9STRA|nr:cyclophilin type peptidyl-prolyl cis-trans isomerase [Nitzschia inconspicua]
MPRIGGSQTSQSYLVQKRNPTLPTTNELAPAPASGNNIPELKSIMNNPSTSRGTNPSSFRSSSSSGAGLAGILSPRVGGNLPNKAELPYVHVSGGVENDAEHDAQGRSSRSYLRAAESGKGSLLPDFASSSSSQTDRIRRQPPNRSKSTGGLVFGFRGSASQQTLPQTTQDLRGSTKISNGGSTFSALRRRTQTHSDDELDNHSVSSNKRDYRTDSDAFYRSTSGSRRNNLSSQNSSSSRNGASLWGIQQHGNYTSFAKLGRMKLGNILQVVIVLAVTALVWESHHKALFAAEQLKQFKNEESLLLMHLQKIEQQSIQLHENLSRLAQVGTGGRLTGGAINSSAGGKVDFDLIHKQTQQLYQMEEELNQEVKALQSRIQQSARNHIIQEFGEGPVQILLELDFGSNDKAMPNKIAILLWHDTPHAAWTILEQIGRNVWDGAEFHWTQGHIIDALPHEPDPMGGKVEFLEQSHHGHEAWTVGLRESDTGAMGLYINLQDNTNVHKHETCVGKVIDGFDALQRLLEASRSQKEEVTAPVKVRKASAMHVTKKEGT